MTTSTSPGLDVRAFRALPPARQAEVVRSRHARVGAVEALRIAVMLGRPRTCVPGILAYGLGLGYAGVPAPAQALLGAVLAFLVGFSANLHNTYTDIDEDCHNLPGRMWLLYRFGHRRLRHLLVGVNVFMAGAALLYGAGFFAFMVIGLIGLHQYSFPPLRMKARPILGLYVFAQAVVGPFLIGWFGAGHAMRAPDPRAWAMLGFLFVWFVAKGLFKNVPDYAGDRAAGLRTSATIFATRAGAAKAAAAVTIVAYLALPILVWIGASPPRVAIALPWALAAAWQVRRLVRAPDGAAGNAVLRTDMALSSAFLATVLLLQDPSAASALLVAGGAVTLLGSDLLAMDTRRGADSATTDSATNGRATTGRATAGRAAAGPASDRPATPQRLFDRVAPRYDLFNSLLSGGRDRYWRRETARRLQPAPGARVLDVATGTGALAIAIADAQPTATIVGCDVNAAMLTVAARRIARHKGTARITLTRADGQRLPFPSGSFDAVSIAFAIDDMPDRRRCAAELVRVLRPGGRLALLELAVPERPVPRRAYLAVLRVLTLVGRARGMAGYDHLRAEITGYRGADAIRSLLTEAGLTGYRRTPLTLGIAVLHLGEVPEREG